MSAPPPINYAGKILHETAKAYLVEFTNDEVQRWIPKSQIREMVMEGDEWVFSVTNWWVSKQDDL